jgi:hypothetical protein
MVLYGGLPLYTLDPSNYDSLMRRYRYGIRSYNAIMERTTITADEALLERLRAIAHQEGVSLAEVIRQGMRWRASARRFTFVGAVTAGPATAIADEAEDLRPQPQPWR